MLVYSFPIQLCLLSWYHVSQFTLPTHKTHCQIYFKLIISAVLLSFRQLLPLLLFAISANLYFKMPSCYMMSHIFNFFQFCQKAFVFIFPPLFCIFLIFFTIKVSQMLRFLYDCYGEPHPLCCRMWLMQPLNTLMQCLICLFNRMT